MIVCYAWRALVVLQPRVVGGFTEEGSISLLEPAIANVMAFLDGRPQGLVNLQVYAQRRPT
jgi:hypothetical protein